MMVLLQLPPAASACDPHTGHLTIHPTRPTQPHCTQPELPQKLLFLFYSSSWVRVLRPSDGV